MGTNGTEGREELAPSVTAGELISALEGMADACRGAAGAVRVHSTPHGSVFGVPVQPADQNVVRGVLRLADVLAEQAGVRSGVGGLKPVDGVLQVGDVHNPALVEVGLHPRGHLLERLDRLEIVADHLEREVLRRQEHPRDGALAVTIALPECDPDADKAMLAKKISQALVDGQRDRSERLAVEDEGDVAERECGSHDASPSLGGGAHSVGAGDAAGASVREVPADSPECDECVYCGRVATEGVLLSQAHLAEDLLLTQRRLRDARDAAATAGLLDDVYDIACELQKTVATGEGARDGR